jgi:hypothetical protein
MPRFDLENYASVGERLAQFHLDYPDGRIITELIETHEEPKRTWVVKATIYLSSSDQAEALPKATGHAAEIEGSGGANNVAPLPNAETSAIGRALMVMNYSMNKDPRTLASREEMKKVDRATRDWSGEASRLDDVTALRLLWAEAKAAGAPKLTLDGIEKRAKSVASPPSATA